MALELNPANAYSLPVRWGDLFGGVNEAFNFANSTVATRADTISNDYLTFARQGEVIDSLYTEARDVAADLGDFAGYLFGLAEATLSRMCLDDTARPRTDDLAGYFDKLDRDLRAADRKWTLPTVSGAVAVPGTNAGDGYLIGDVKEPVDGQACYFAYAEVIRLECSADSHGNATDAGAEEFEAFGEAAVALRDPLWPRGSGATATLTAVVPETSAEVTDGAFDEWTNTNTPTNWSLLAGTVAGTHVFQEASTSAVYTTDGSAVRFQGDGSTAGLGVYQVLDQDVVLANTNYAVSLWYRSGATSAVTGADLRVALTDGDGTVLTDNASASVSDTITNTNFTDADDTWTRKTLVLRTPRSLPAELRLELKFTGTLIAHGGSDTKKVWVDHLTMSPMEQLYAGGPYLALHGGNTPFATRDAFTYTVANTGDEETFVGSINRTFDLAGNGIRLTVTGTTAIDDALIA